MFSNMELLFNLLWAGVLAGITILVIVIMREGTEGEPAPAKSMSPILLSTRMAWNNLWRKPLRTMLLMLSSAITAAVIFLSYFFLNSLDRSLTATGQRFGADVMVVPKGYGAVAQNLLLSGTVSPFYMPASVLHTVRKIPEVQAATPQLYLETFSGTCCQVEGNFPVIAFDPQTDFTLKPWLTETGKREFTKESVVIGSSAGGSNAIYHLDYGSYQERLQLFGHPFTVSQVLFPTGTEVDNTLFMDLERVRELRKAGKSSLRFPEDSISVVLVKTLPGDEELVRREIERTIAGVTAVTGVGIRATIEQKLLPLRLLTYSMIVLVVVMAGLQALALFSAIISERKREIGMFRALGASRRNVFSFLLREAGMAGCLGGAAGITAVIIILYDNRILLQKWMQLPLAFHGWLEAAKIGLGALALTITVGLAAASIPLWGIVRSEPYMAIREGE